MNDSRSQILARLATRPGVPALPQAWQSDRQFDDLAERFTTSLTKAHGEVFRASSWEEAVEQVDVILRELNVSRAVMNDEARLGQLQVKERWGDIAWHVVGDPAGNLREACTEADIGLTSVSAALAETGSLVITSGQGLSRLVSLLPPVHLALVPLSYLTTDIFTWTAGRSGTLPSNLVLVSGPSKTADIEMTLSVGVHGPKRLLVILYQD